MTDITYSTGFGNRQAPDVVAPLLAANHPAITRAMAVIEAERPGVDESVDSRYLDWIRCGHRVVLDDQHGGKRNGRVVGITHTHARGQVDKTTLRVKL